MMLPRYAITILASGLFWGGNAFGAACQPTGGQVVADGCDLVLPGGTVTTGSSSYNAAVVAQGGGSIQVTAPLEVRTTGHDASGIYVQSDGQVVFQVTGNVIVTEGNGAYGVHGFGPSSFSGQADIETSGTQAHAAFTDFGGAIVLDAATLTTHGERSAGAAIQGGGTILLQGATRIITTGGSAPGLYALNGGSYLTLDASGATASIHTSGVTSHGAMVQSGGAMSITGPLTVATTGDSSHGLNAVDAGSSLDVRGVDINTTGAGSLGATASGGAALSLAQATLHTSGQASHGLVVSGAGSTLSAAKVTVSAQQGFGAMAGDGGELTWNSGALSTQGAGAIGLYAGGTDTGGGRIAATDLALETAGSQAHGAAADNGGEITLTGGTLTTHGAQAAGLIVKGDGRITAANLTVNTTGTGAHGAAILDGAQISLQNVDLRTAGSSASALDVETSGGSAGAVGRVNMNGGSLHAGQDAAIRVAGATAGVALTNGVTVTSGIGKAIDVLTQSNVAGALALDADHATLMGDIHVDAQAGSTALLSFSAGSLLTGAVDGATRMTVRDSQWIVTGDSSVTGTLTNAGTIVFAAPETSFKTIATNDYLGVDGALGFNVRLGNDASPTDRLIVGNAVTGSTRVQIRNAQGQGDITDQGILLIAANNRAATGAFSLASPVVAGPYEYTLQRADMQGSSTSAWYLRSTIDCAAANAPSPPCPAPPAPPNPTPPDPTPPNPTPPPKPIPNYRPEVSLYTAIAPLTLLYAHTLLDTLHERTGTDTDTPDRGQSADSTTIGRMWARALGTQGSQDGGRAGIYGRSPSYDYEFGGVQLGGDLLQRRQASGARDRAGLHGAIGRARTDVTHFNGANAGTNTVDGYTLGAYWTHIGQSGWYADSIIQGTWYDAKAEPARALPALHTHGFGWAVSAEGGYPVLQRESWRIEPQVQLVYQSISLDDTNDLAASVRFSNLQSIAGRLGARAAYTSEAIGLWLRVSAWHEFEGRAQTEFLTTSGAIPFHGSLNGSWWEYKAGADARIGRTTHLYASFGYEHSFDGTRSSWDGKIGVRASW